MIEKIQDTLIQLPINKELGVPLLDEEGNPELDEETGEPIVRYPLEHLVANERVVADCGCAMYVGLLIPKDEAGVVAIPHDPDHIEFLRAWQEAHKATLGNGDERTAVEVIEEVLQGMSA